MATTVKTLAANSCCYKFYLMAHYPPVPQAIILIVINFVFLDVSLFQPFYGLKNLFACLALLFAVSSY